MQPLDFFSEVCRLLALSATKPASVATAERSHSALKRLKAYLAYVAL